MNGYKKLTVIVVSIVALTLITLLKNVEQAKQLADTILLLAGGYLGVQGVIDNNKNKNQNGGNGK